MHQMPDYSDPEMDTQNVIPMLKRLYKTECHIFERQGHHILFNVATGNFFEIDQVQLDMIGLCEGRTLNEILSALEDHHTEKQILSAFKELLDAGIVTDTLPEQTAGFSLPNRLEIVHFDLSITTDTLSGSKDPVAYMDEEVALQALALLLKESGRVRQCSIAFRGGEPLLNAPLVEKVIEEGYRQAKALGKEIRFQVVTDARLLNQSLFNRLAKSGVDVVIKFDGDMHKPLFHGQGSYSLSSQGLPEHLKGKDATVDLSYAVDHHRADFTQEIKQVLTQYPKIRQVVFDSDGGDVSSQNLAQIQGAYDNLAEFVETHVLQGGQTWIDGIESHIYQVFNQKASFSHCGIGVRALTVAPDGALHPGVARDKVMGTVWDGVNREEQGHWIRETQVDKLEGCKTCWARHLCGGGCKVQVQGETEAKQAQCELVQHQYELAMNTCLSIASRDRDVLYQRYAE